MSDVNLLLGVHPETASFGPCLRSRLIAILDVAQLRLWLQKACGLDLIRNLPFLNGHKLNFAITLINLKL